MAKAWSIRAAVHALWSNERQQLRRQFKLLLVASYGVGMTLVLIFAGRLIESLYRFGESMVDSRSSARFVVERAPAIAATIQVIAGFFLVVISYGALT